MGSSASLAVLAPGLVDQRPAPAATPALDLLQARADRLTAPQRGLTPMLLETFGAGASAPYALAADDPGWDRVGAWLHADPVHLRADRDRLRLFDAGLFDIPADEAAQLVAALNDHFQGDGLYFHAPTPTRWYLRVEPLPELDHPPLEAMTGQCLDRRLPSTAAARRWNQLMNEAQMLLFQAPVNRAREARNRPLINGLWTWGGGTWSPLHPPEPIAAVCADDPLTRGLAAAAGVTLAPGPPTDGRWPVGTTLLVVPTLALAGARGDASGWAAGLAQLEQSLAPALTALRASALARISLDGGDGRCWRLERRHLWRFWRRP